jgi:hypothetical protein
MIDQQMPQFDLPIMQLYAALFAMLLIGLMVTSHMPRLVMPLLVTESCLPGMPQVEGPFSLATAVPACWLAR